jgi:allantoinase
MLSANRYPRAIYATLSRHASARGGGRRDSDDRAPRARVWRASHIVHVASAEAADEVARAKADGVGITAETCPHYLTFAAEDVPDGATEFKCAPPIREARHRTALWSALTRGTLDLVATDHSPAPPALKCPGDFMKAWGGISSLELSLAAVWTSVSTSSRGPFRPAWRG